MDENIEFDAVDRRIIAALQHDARITNRELAEHVGLSPSACLARVKNLRALNVITGFAAELDLARIGRPIQAIIAVRMRTHDRADLDEFVRALARLDAMIGIFHVTGEADYLLHVAVSSTDALRNLVLDQLTSREEVAQVTTSLVFDHVRSHTVPTTA